MIVESFDICLNPSHDILTRSGKLQCFLAFNWCVVNHVILCLGAMDLIAGAEV